MNLEELKQKIEEGNGTYEPIDGLTFKQESKDDTIYIKCKREEEEGDAFIMNGGEDFKSIYLSSSQYIIGINKFIRFVRLLSHALDFDIKIETVVEKEVKVEVEKIVIEEKTQGMIEAYEKILFGRKVTLENNTIIN